MLNVKDVKSVLIIGMAGGLAKITAGLLAKKYPNISITGVDPRPISESIKKENIEYREMKYTRGNFEKLFREKQFDMVVHLGRMSHASASPKESLAQRLDLNLMGTKRILDLSLKFFVKKVIILSTYHVYGALADNPVFISEDSPLRASIKHPELRDVVEMDQICTNWMWKNQQEIETIVLRPCTIIGPQIKNTMSQYLLTPYAPVCMDFNPMFQFVHEFDMANVLIQCMERVPTGIYNVATEEVISIKEAKRVLDLPTIPFPSFVLEAGTKLLSNVIWTFPKYLIDYIKFACIIDSSALHAHMEDNVFRYNIPESLELLKLD